MRLVQLINFFSHCYQILEPIRDGESSYVIEKPVQLSINRMPVKMLFQVTICLLLCQGIFFTIFYTIFRSLISNSSTGVCSVCVRDRKIHYIDADSNPSWIQSIFRLPKIFLNLVCCMIKISHARWSFYIVVLSSTKDVCFKLFIFYLRSV